MESSDLPPAAAQLLRPTSVAHLAPPVHACSPAAAHAAIKKRKRAAAAASHASPAAASPTVASPTTARAVVALAFTWRKKVAGSGPKKATQGGGKKQVVKPCAAAPQASPPVAGFAAPQRSDVGAGNVFDEMPSRYDVSRFSFTVHTMTLEGIQRVLADDWSAYRKQATVLMCKQPEHVRYEEGASIARGGGEQLDKKMDVKLDMKTSYGCAREERESCARGGDVQAGAQPCQPAVPPGRPAPGPENKNSAYIITWRDYEALRNEMRREFRTQDDELRGTCQGISQKLDATSETVTTMKDQMTDIQRSLQVLQLVVDNLTQQQQQEEAEDPDLQDEAPGVGRGVGRGHRARGFAELGRHGRGFEEEDGLGKPKFSIPKFEGGADVEEYLT
ncbi:hypothetical protein QYE76_009368 [Lolium multiflorum]|uniref:Uncharacterized protein n=1 Tax=Lolium multiflorum TaxID=4521 RepID=A0AAD8X168_LOLMU|nr:hypothetical protein QYE76_009368 [Lolium multiflorum]